MADKQNKPGVLELPPPPEEPLPDECCGRGCENCVYVYYERALARWQDKVAAIMSKHGIEFVSPGRDD